MIGQKKYIDIVKTIFDKGYDAKHSPLTDMSYHDFLQYMPASLGNVPRRTWQPIAEAVAKMFEDNMFR
jgi:hypothetical protein